MSEELKIKRPAIKPLSEWVEQFILGFGIGSFDMADEGTRKKLKAYVESFLRHCLRSTLSELQRGADRGLRQTLDFMFDPQHAESVKKRRIERKAKRVKATMEVRVGQLMREKKELGKVQ